MAQSAVLGPRDLYNVAANQKRLLLVILAGILAYASIFVLAGMAPEEGDTAGAAVFGLLMLGVLAVIVGLAVAWLIFLALLLSAMRVAVAVRIIALIGALLPLISLIVLLAASSQATGVLKRAGHKVGLLGVKSNTLARLKSEAALA